MGHIELTIEAPIAKIVINKPGSMNAFNEDLCMEFVSKLNEVKKREDVRVIILRGSGNTFSTGADLKRFAEFLPNLTAEKVREVYPYMEQVFDGVDYIEKVTIASINGFALAGGFVLAAVCDLRIASDRSMFGMPEIQFGMFPTFLSIPRIARLIGLSLTQEIILTGNIFSVERAREIGFVHRIVPHDKLDEETDKLAKRIVDNAPLVVSKTKKGFIMLKKGQLENYKKFDNESLEYCILTEDFDEGVRAVLERRKPIFKGK